MWVASVIRAVSVSLDTALERASEIGLQKGNRRKKLIA
jgi:hypothetical protein